MSIQPDLMKYAPHTGEAEPYPSTADHWRAHHGKVAWLFDPWTGEARNAYDIGTDVFGHLIVHVPITQVKVKNLKPGTKKLKVFPGDPGWVG